MTASENEQSEREGIMANGGPRAGMSLVTLLPVHGAHPPRNKAGDAVLNLP